MDFEWDSAKATANARKHGVSFEEAVTALRDDFAATASRLVARIGRVPIYHLWHLCQWPVTCGLPHEARKPNSYHLRTLGNTHGQENIWRRL